MQIDISKLVTLYGESQLENKLLVEQLQTTAKENAALRKELADLRTSAPPPEPDTP